MDERDAREWLCRNLPALRLDAAAHGSQERLDAALSALADHHSALRVITELNGAPPEADPARGTDDGTDPYLLMGLGRSDLAGDYHCPRGWCPRRAESRDERGRPPWCELYRVPMRFREE